MSRRVADVLQDVASLEILQAPGLTFSIPDQFASQPRLTGVPADDHAARSRSSAPFLFDSASALAAIIGNHKRSRVPGRLNG